MFRKKTDIPEMSEYDGVKVTALYKSPYRKEGIPFASQRTTKYLKEEFVSWFANYGNDRKYDLSSSELAFIQGEVQNSKARADHAKEKDKKERKRTLLIVTFLPLAIYLFVAIIIIGKSDSSPETLLWVLKNIFLLLIFPSTLGIAVTIATLSKIKARRYKYRSNETTVIAESMQNGHFTAYQFEIVQKKWREYYVSAESTRDGYYSHDFYVEFDALTLEVDRTEYRKMNIGGNAIVVMIHTPSGDTMYVFAQGR